MKTISINHTFGSALRSLHKGIAVVTLSLVALVSSASADTVSYTENFASITNGGISLQIYLPKFDSSLGTLTGIIFETNILGDHSIQATNNSGGGGEYDLNSRITVSLMSGIIRYNATNSIYQPTVYLNSGATETFTGQASGNSVATYDAAGNKLSGPATASGTIDISNFIGAGTIQISATASGVGGGSGPTPNNITANASSTGSVTITYQYEAVPEPSTWAAIAIGAGILAVYRRRRSA